MTQLIPIQQPRYLWRLWSFTHSHVLIFPTGKSFTKRVKMDTVKLRCLYGSRRKYLSLDTPSSLLEGCDWLTSLAVPRLASGLTTSPIALSVISSSPVTLTVWNKSKCSIQSIIFSFCKQSWNLMTWTVLENYGILFHNYNKPLKHTGKDVC